MRLRAVHHQTQTQRVLVIVCDVGEEAVEAVTGVLCEQGIRAAQVTAVGGLSGGELGYYDRSVRDYTRIPVREQVEMLSLIGDVAERDGEPALHVHAVLGRRDGSTIGGHLLRGEVWPTLEVIITEVAPHLAKRVDPETGLALISAAEDR
jgi:predicted DNA-binding protein with PD1-like motif